MLSKIPVTIMLLGAAGLVSGQTTSTGSGQAYPNKPVRIVTAGVGGAGDFVARLIAQGLAGQLGQPVIVDNRGSALIPGEIVAKAPTDGYTLLVAGGAFAIGPLLQPTPYDPIKDFSPISLVASAPNILVVHPSLPVKSVKELIALAKARPGELNYASSAAGSTVHLTAELFKAMAGVNIVRIPYTSGSTQMTDMIAGRVQLTFGNAPTLAQHIKSGRLRPLAVTSAHPSALFPDLPTVAASLPGYEAATATGVFAPAKTPAAIINRLNHEVVRFLTSAEAKEQLLSNGAEAVGSSPQEYAARIKAEIARLGKVIKDVGIRAE